MDVQDRSTCRERSVLIGLDTNILVRYLTQDDPDQAAQATRIVEEEQHPHPPAQPPSGLSFSSSVDASTKPYLA